ncbi:Hypothetical_protein [Hexamita inflata]|uniref:Hypothetical_protein n=1 Tax=Hexamita inflata TaxID=28002 RepID=A0AA86U2W2_9EUKA|nr:Hypothetical protein HINF_LOCUS26069 [Hexamita inflata]
MVSTVGQVYPAFVSASISQASSISVLYESSESSLVHLVTSSTLLCQLSIHQLLRVDFSSEYEYHHTCQRSKAIILIPWNYVFMIVDFVSSYHLFLIHDCCAVIVKRPRPKNQKNKTYVTYCISQLIFSQSKKLSA